MVVQDFAKCWDTMSATLPVGVHMFKPSDPVELLAEIDDQFVSYLLLYDPENNS
jgi:hypothetical protein